MNSSITPVTLHRHEQALHPHTNPHLYQQGCTQHSHHLLVPTPNNHTLSCDIRSSHMQNKGVGYIPCTQHVIHNRIHREHLRKRVRLILMVQLLLTLAFLFIAVSVIPIQQWIHNNAWLFWCLLGVLVALGVLQYFINPANCIFLGIFTLNISCILGTFTAVSFFDAKIVLIAAGITGALCLPISIYATQTEFDFTMHNGILLLIYSVVNGTNLAYLIWTGTLDDNHTLYGGLIGVFLWTYLQSLVYDTRMMMGGRKSDLQSKKADELGPAAAHGCGPYMLGAKRLYLLVVTLYIGIVELCYNCLS